MRTLSCLVFALLASLIAAAAPGANDPAPLLKAVAPGANWVRVRVPVVEARGTTMHFKGQIPKKGKKGEKPEMVDVSIGIETLPGPSYVSTKLWESWGYEVPPDKMVVLPELVILGSQIAPKGAKSGRDVQVKVSGIRLEVVDPPGGAEQVNRCDIYLTMRGLLKNSYAPFEPRVYFQDKFFELSVPTGAVKRPGTDSEPPADPAITDDKDLVALSGPMALPRGIPVFAYASINGVTEYKLADGKGEIVQAGISSTNDWPTGVVMTMGLARGCKVELDPEKEAMGKSATAETRLALGTVKELRLGMKTLTGQKMSKDVVIKDLTVYVDKANSGHFMWLGPRFVDTYFKDPIFACDSLGSWAFYGRAKPELLQDIKTRPKKSGG